MKFFNLFGWKIEAFTSKDSICCESRNPIFAFDVWSVTMHAIKNIGDKPHARNVSAYFQIVLFRKQYSLNLRKTYAL